MTHTFRAAQQPDGPVGQRPLGQGMLLLVAVATFVFAKFWAFKAGTP